MPARAGGSVQGVTTAILFATAPGDGGGPAAGMAWEDTTLLGRLCDQLAALGLQDVHVVTRPAWSAGFGGVREDGTARPASRVVREGRTVAEGAARSARFVREGAGGEDGVRAAMHASPDLAGDLRLVAELAGEGDGGVVLANADVLTQREVLAGLLADPRVPTGVLSSGGSVGRLFGFRTRSRRGRVVSAASPYHSVHRPNATFLGVLKVAGADRERLGGVAERLAELTTGGLPEDWEAELDAKRERWRAALHRRTLAGAGEDDHSLGVDDAPRDETEAQREADAEPADALAATFELEPEDAAELERRLAAARQDACALLLCGLVREEVQIGHSRIRGLFWARPLATADLDLARKRIGAHDEEAALLDSAVKSNDGFFTTFFVSPYSKYVARWAARRGWTPNGVTTLSVALGFLSATAFATGERWGLVAGAILLQVAFTFDCVDGQLARYTRTFTKLGAWLDSIFDRTKEYAVFAGLAIGAARTGEDVWLLAGAALALQTMRHAVDFSYPQAQHQALGAQRHPPLEQSGDGLAPAGPTLEGPAPPRPPVTRKQRARSAWRALDRSRRARWLKKAISFPIGERFAAISIAAALFDARVTFIVLLAWGGFAAAYTIAGRVLRSIGRRGSTLDAAAAAKPGTLDAYRDDGPLAQAIGRLLGPALRTLPPAALVALGAVPLLAAAAVAGASAPWGLAAYAVAWAVLVAGASAGRTLRDPLRWAVPPLLRLLEYAGVLWLAAIAGALPAGFALLCAVTFRHYDVVYRLRHRGAPPPAWLNRLALGWDGRLLAVLGLGAAGLAPTGLYALAGLYGVVFAGEAIAVWSVGRGRREADVYEDEEEDAE